MKYLIELVEMLKEIDDIQQYINKFEKQSTKGQYYEAIWMLMFLFKCVEKYNEYKMMKGNVNTKLIDEIKNIEDYLKTYRIISSKRTGCSDITLKRKKEYIFMTCKYFASTEDKSIKDYDIQDIEAISSKYDKFKILILVANKQELLQKAKQANKSSEYITKYIIEENIYDINELQKIFKLWKSKILTLQTYDEEKESLNLRFHQKVIIYNTMKKIQEGCKTILWGCKSRTGKTYMSGGLINELKPKKSIVITPLPKETKKNFIDDLFKSYKEFENCDVVEFCKGQDIKDFIQTEKQTIIITSKQLLQNKETDLGEFNLLIFDENHQGGTTTKSKKIIENHTNKNSIKLYLTATYMKPLIEWKITEDCCFYWNMEDEQWCKQRNIEQLKKKHGNIVDIVLKEFYDKGYTLDDIMKPYDEMPLIITLTSQFDQQRYEEIKQRINDTSYGFSMNCLFGLLQTDEQTYKFQYPKEIKLFLRYISGSNKERDFKYGDTSIFTRIKEYSIKHNSRTFNNCFTSQIWFLPFGIGLPINDVSKCLKKLMLEDEILKKYEIMIINSKYDAINDTTKKDLLKSIQNCEEQAKRENKEGLIILAGNQCAIGITLRLVDIVFLLNGEHSSDMIYQRSSRCGTEAENKKFGFVVDFNLGRTLMTMLDYSIYDKSLNTKNKIEYMIHNNLMNIDIDMLENKQLPKQTLINKYMDYWNKDPVNNLTRILNKIRNTYIELTKDDQQLLNTTFTSSKEKKQLIEQEDDRDKQSIKSGVDIEIIKKEPKEKQDDTIKEEIKITIDLNKDVIPYILPLSVLLTIDEVEHDFYKMLELINKDKSLLDLFDTQCNIWWNKTGLIDFIKQLVEKYILKEGEIYNIAIRFKEDMKSLIDKPKELLELIEMMLKPKEEEKKKYAEVFTPFKLVNEMLDKLPKKVWKKKHYKWFDPANGMGNFPIAIYLRLMEGLKEEISNEKERKKHILENMLYMSELNKKNVYLCKKIFDIKNEYKLNLYCGDSLKLDTEKEWGINKFDVIVGNPPYQDGSGNKGKGHTLWTKFVENAINKWLKNKKYLVFVHPSLWRQIDHPLLNLMKPLQIKYIEIHNVEDGQRMFRCSTRYDWYLLKNITYEKITTIKGEDGIITKIDLRQWKFIPNKLFKEIKLLMDSPYKITIIHSESKYEVRRNWMSHNKTEEHIYPCIYTIDKEDNPSFKWSKINSNGHFGEPKFIFSNGKGFIQDTKGKYGLTQWASGIKDDPNNLKKIKDKFLNSKFSKIIDAIHLDSATYNIKVMKEFRKDFYKYID